MPLPKNVMEQYSRPEYDGIAYYGEFIDDMSRAELLVLARALACESQRSSKRIPIRPIADNSGGKFDARFEVEELKGIVRQLTDYVNELRRDVDRLQGLGK